MRVIEKQVGITSVDVTEPSTTSAPVKKAEPRLYRVVWRWHFYAGLIVLPVLLTAAITGGIYVFREELERVMYPHLLFCAPQAQRATYVDQLAHATAVVPEGFEARGFTIFDDPTRATEIFFEKDPDRYFYVYVNPYTGAVQGQAEYGHSFFDIVLSIHRTLFIGTTGRLIVELATSWGIILTVTGLYLWWPRGRNKVFGVWLPRISGKRYVIWRDWHTVPGFYFAVLAFLIMATGLFFSFLFGQGYQLASYATKAIPASYISPPKSLVVQDATPLPLDEIIAIAGREQSEKRLFINLPPTNDASVSVFCGSYDDPTLLTYLYIDQYSGAVLDRLNWQKLSLMAKTQIVAYPIHVGSIWGVPTKILAVLVCVMIVAMTVTGAVMWWVRRPRGRTGFPQKTSAHKPAKWLIGLILLLGVIMPASGLSMLAILLGDWLFRSWQKRRLQQAPL